MAKTRGRYATTILTAGMGTFALASGFITAVPAWAASSVDLSTADLTAVAAASGGAFSVSGPSVTDDLTINGDVRLTGSAAPGRVVTITGGTEETPRVITLENVAAFAGNDSAAIQLASGAHARVTLAGTSTLMGSASRPGLGIPIDAGLVITAGSPSAGRLDVTGTGNAAAIGGDGNAVLTNPVKPITLTGVAGASCGSLTISGGTINAKVTSSTATGAAIGGGRFGTGCSVSISGGVVNASASAGAGIGGGIGQDAANGYGKDSPGGAGGAVRISGGTVTASSTGIVLTGETDPRYSAAIGGGRGGGGGAEDQGSDGAPGTLTITGGSIKLSPRQASGFTPSPTDGSQLLAQVKIPSAAGATQIAVTPTSGDPSSFAVAGNHPSDDALYLFLPYPKTYAIAVTAGASTTTYKATTASTGADATAYIPPADPAKLAAAGVSFESVTVDYPAQTAKAVTVDNTGGTTATITSASVAPSGIFTVDKPSTVSVPAGGSNSEITVTPITGLAVGTHEATLTLGYEGGKSITVPLSFTVLGVPQLQLSAPSFAGGVVGVYQPVAGILTIKNTGSADADLSSVVSSNPAAFTVENKVGKLAPGSSLTAAVTPAAGLGVGSYSSTITASYNGKSVTAPVSFTVSPQPVVAINAGQTMLTLVKGKSLSIPAYGYESNGKSVSVAWTSSNASIATVSSKGSIKGIKAGTAKVTASAGGKSVTVSVKVISKKSKTKVKSVSAKISKTMKVGSRAYVTGKFSPSTAPSAKVTYSSSKKSVLTIDSAGTITAKKKGKATVTIKAGGKSKKYTVTVK